MDARTTRSLYAIAFAAMFLLPQTVQAGGSTRTQNFVVSAPTQALAREIADAAERYRRELALSWLGHELPAWQDPCRVQANVDPRLGAGGATSFLFETEARHFARPVGDGLFQAKPAGRPYGWDMTLQGSRERVLDSVLPHEITHTVFATHFGRPLPRWADEGACTTVEHESEKSKQHRMLYEFLKTERGIPFNRMFSMTEYPKDILPLYSQGFSLARFLIYQGGRRKFVDYIGEGLNSNNWSETTRKHYGFNSISDLQLTWLDWVRNGSQELPANQPAPSPPNLIANASSQRKLERAPSSANGRQSIWRHIPSTERLAASPEKQTLLASNTKRDVPSDGGATTETSWYARQKSSSASRSEQRLEDRSTTTRSATFSVQQKKPRVATRPNPSEVQREVILEWGSPSEFLNPRLAARRTDAVGG